MSKSKILYIIAAGILSTGLYSCYEKFDPESYAPDVSIGGYTSSADIAPSNLIAYFPFDGSYAESISKTNGENTGTTFAGGIKGQALKGAKNAYVLFTPTPAILGLKSFTMTYWVNSQSTTAAGGIIGLVTLSNTKNFWGNMETFFENGGTNENGKFRAHVQNDSLDTWVSKDGLINLFDSWNHITVSYDGASSTFNLYVNGSKTYTNTVKDFGNINWKDSGKMVFGTDQFQTDPSQTVAADAQSWASFLTGSLDEVRIYNIALSDTDVDALVKLEARGK